MKGKELRESDPMGPKLSDIFAQMPPEQVTAIQNLINNPPRFDGPPAPAVVNNIKRAVQKRALKEIPE